MLDLISTTGVAGRAASRMLPFGPEVKFSSSDTYACRLSSLAPSYNLRFCHHISVLLNMSKIEIWLTPCIGLWLEVEKRPPRR